MLTQLCSALEDAIEEIRVGGIEVVRGQRPKGERKASLEPETTQVIVLTAT